MNSLILNENLHYGVGPSSFLNQTFLSGIAKSLVLSAALVTRCLSGSSGQSCLFSEGIVSFARYTTKGAQSESAGRPVAAIS